MRYTVILKPAEEGGYLVRVPAFPEVITDGDTVKECLDNAKEAIELAMEIYQERGDLIPGDVKIAQVEVNTPLD